MKKIFLFLLTILTFTSCLTRVDLNNTGSLSLNISWPEVASNNISKAIKIGTTQIKVNLYNSATNETIEKILVHTDSEKHILLIDNLSIGTWDLHITCYDSLGNETGSYFDLATISADTPYVVVHSFGSPNKISYAISDSGYIEDGGVLTGYGYLGVYDAGNSYNDSSVFLTNAILQVSEDKNFTTTVGIPHEFYLSVPQQGMLLSVSCGIGVTADANIRLEPNKIYYWRVISVNVYGATISKTFSFKTSTIIP